MLNNYEEEEEGGHKTYQDIQDGMQITMGGMISAYKKLKTRSGSFMAFVTVEDLYGSIECVCFPKIYEKIRNFLESDRVVSLSGKISIEDDKAPAIIVEKMTEFTLDEGENEKTAVNVSVAPSIGREEPPAAKPQPKEKADSEKTLWLNVTHLEEEDIEELLDTLSFYTGETEVVFVQGKKKMRCTQKVAPNKALMAELASFLPESCIKLL
jgi:DNA polymerase III alpha subunit